MWSLGDLGVSNIGRHIEIRTSISEEDGVGRDRQEAILQETIYSQNKREPR